MAKSEQAQEFFTDTRTMANNIVTSKSADIATMQKLLG